MTLRYRFAEARDVDVVVDLVESAYRGERSLAGWTSEADLIGGRRTDAAMIADLVATEGAYVLLAEEGDVVQACCELRAPATPHGVAYFGMFAVRPEVQTGGYGRAVLARAEQVARDDLHAAAMQMTVIEQRATLIAWYERRGFTRTGELRPFPYGDERFGAPKRPDLRFVVLGKDLP